MRYFIFILVAMFLIACGEKKEVEMTPTLIGEPMCGLANGVDFLEGMDNCWQANDGERLFIQEDCIVYQELPDGSICFGNMATADCKNFNLVLCQETHSVGLVLLSDDWLILDFQDRGEVKYKRTWI